MENESLNTDERDQKQEVETCTKEVNILLSKQCNYIQKLTKLLSLQMKQKI